MSKIYCGQTGLLEKAFVCMLRVMLTSALRSSELVSAVSCALAIIEGREIIIPLICGGGRV
jgi:hypothetical protein